MMHGTCGTLHLGGWGGNSRKNNWSKCKDSELPQQRAGRRHARQAQIAKRSRSRAHKPTKPRQRLTRRWHVLMALTTPANSSKRP